MDQMMGFLLINSSLATMNNSKVYLSLIIVLVFVDLVGFSAGPFAFREFFCFFENHPT